MSGSNELRTLFLALADLYDTEGRKAGTEAASALREAANDISKEWPITTCPKPGLAEAALSIDPHPKSNIIFDALPYLAWFAPDECIANLKTERAAQMMACELLGPTGMFKSNDLRVGLYVQKPNFDYPTRTHAAEETYIALGGVGYWGTKRAEPSRKSTGDIMWLFSALLSEKLHR